MNKASDIKIVKKIKKSKVVRNYDIRLLYI